MMKYYLIYYIGSLLQLHFSQFNKILFVFSSQCDFD